MNAFVRRLGLVAVVLGTFSASTCNALVIAQSSLTILELKIEAVSGYGVTFSDPWFASAFAEADENQSFVDTPLFLATANSPFATGVGSADPLTLLGSASSSVFIPDGVATSSFATGRGTPSSADFFNFILNTFTVTGGTSGDPVVVTFSAKLAGSHSVLTNNLGASAITETNFYLGVDGAEVLFRSQNVSIGPNEFQFLPFAESLSRSLTLESGMSYILVVEADSESRGLSTVPEPSTYGIVGVALILLKAVLRSRKPITNQSV